MKILLLTILLCLPISPFRTLIGRPSTERKCGEWATGDSIRVTFPPNRHGIDSILFTAIDIFNPNGNGKWDMIANDNHFTKTIYFTPDVIKPMRRLTKDGGQVYIRLIPRLDCDTWSGKVEIRIE